MAINTLKGITENRLKRGVEGKYEA